MSKLSWSIRDESLHIVHESGIPMARCIRLEDGYFYVFFDWPGVPSHAGYTSDDLRDIARCIDEANAEWHRQVLADLGKEK